MTVRPSFVSGVLLAAVLGVSLSGPLVRLSHAPPIAIAVWRLAFALLLIAIPLMAGGTWTQWRTLDRTALVTAFCGGGLLALHFWWWNTSIGLTTIAASVVLVNMQPLVVALLSVVLLREPPTRSQWLGIGIAVLGAVVVAMPDLLRSGAQSFEGSAAFGDVLALGGAVTAAGYYVVGRRLRASLDLWAYVALVYAACLVVLLLIAALTRTPLGPYPRREFAIFALLAVGPMMLGHTALNWALRYARAYQVNIVLLGEPIGAALIAATLPSIHEHPSVGTAIGGALILGGILLARQRNRS